MTTQQKSSSDARPKADVRFVQRLGDAGRSLWGILWRGALAFVLLSLLQVLYVRWFPPLTTLTMVSYQLESLIAGEEPSIRHEWIALDDLPQDVKDAVLTGEDAQFYRHWGFDFEQIRKAWKANQAGKPLRGASTISQQTARNVFLWQHRSWLRKGLEAYYTLGLELLVPKNRILELYLNVAEWGDGVFGIEAAAQKYYRKSARELTRKESAALAASLPNPLRYPPDVKTTFHARRKALILSRMNTVMPPEARRVVVPEQD